MCVYFFFFLEKVKGCEKQNRCLRCSNSLPATLVPLLNLCPTPTGGRRGLVVDIGHSCTRVVPIVDGLTIGLAIFQASHFVGASLSKFLFSKISLIFSRGWPRE